MTCCVCWVLIALFLIVCIAYWLVRRRFVAYIERTYGGYKHACIKADRDQVISALKNYCRPPTEQQTRVSRVLEVGGAVGRTFDMMPKNTEVTVIEPWADFESAYRDNASASGRGIHVKDFMAEGVETGMGKLPKDHFDLIISSFTMCQVPKKIAFQTEALRVLKKGGALVMIEHVRSRRLWLWLLQLMFRPLIIALFVKCDIVQDPVGTLQRVSGFRIVYKREFARKTSLLWILFSQQVGVIAVKE